VASKLQLLAALALTFTSSAIMPAASRLSVLEDGHESLSTMFLEGTKYTMALAIPITVTMMVWADAFVRTWIGHGFDPSIGYARWFLVWVLIASCTSVGLTIIVGIGYAREAMLIALASALLNLGISIALVRPLGVLGVIVGTVVGNAVVTYPYMRLF